MSDLGRRLVFVISPPRAGSTLLLRILHAAPGIHGEPEPHVIPPLAHLGPWRRVDRAPYDPIRSQEGLRAFVARLPDGEAGWLRAARAYADSLYGDMLDASGARLLVDKTPANALCLPLLQRLYPDARYVVLTRHPAAIALSHADSFFGGDLAAACAHNPVLERWLPPMARWLRQRPVPLLHLSYEALVTTPQASLDRLAAFLDHPLPATALDYQQVAAVDGPGDPTGVHRFTRPVPDRVDAWVEGLADPARFAVVARQLAGISSEDLAAWGTPRSQLWAPLQQARPDAWRRAAPTWQRYRLQRRALVALRRDIHRRPHGRLLAGVKLATEVLLRGS